MRRAAVMLALLFVLLAGIPGLAAAAPTRPMAAATDPTAIQGVTPSALVAGVPTTLVANLRDTATSQPVGGAVLTFSEETRFGRLLLGNGTTSDNGEAGVPYEPAHNGTYTIDVAFAGNASYAPSNTTLSLTVLPGASPPAPPISSDELIVLVILAVVGGVWLTYAFVALQILGIRSIGSRPEDEAFESQELKKMEKAEKAVETPGTARGYVPARANANRAVVYLAISALILSGTAVALLLTGGVGHTAAYTPTTVSLQVTVVPDFQGSGYDAFVPDELVVHQGDTVKITVFNEDTMPHGFEISEYGVNQPILAASQDNVTGDITPTTTVISFTATTAGSFLWFCTEYCGPGHQYMDGTLVVLPDD